MRNWQLEHGYSVYGQDDQKIGTVGEVQGDYFKMDTGFLGLGSDYYVPMDAVTDVRGDRVYISATKDQLSSLGWDSWPPRGTRTSTGSFRQDSDYVTGTAPREGGLRSDIGSEERRMPLREEQLDVNRTERQVGDVTVSKDIEEQRQRVNVPVNKEEVYVERRPASGEAAPGDINDDEEINIPVREEDVNVGKRTVTREEMVVGKNEVTEDKPVEETVRREVPRVEKHGDVREIDETDTSKLSDEERRRREQRGPF